MMRNSEKHGTRDITLGILSRKQFLDMKEKTTDKQSLIQKMDWTYLTITILPCQPYVVALTWI